VPTASVLPLAAFGAIYCPTMWLKEFFTPNQPRSQLPVRLFISHAYADQAVRDRLIAVLPADAEAIVYPPIVVPPQEMVSTPLIRALRDCDGLIYLKGGASGRSFWVAFERDYALRMDKPVFEADPNTLVITRTMEKPLQLPVFASCHHEDRGRVTHICSFMRKERNFDIWLDVEMLQAGEAWQEAIHSAIAKYVDRGYLVAFWSHIAASSNFMCNEIQFAAERIGTRFNDRVVFASLDDAPLPDFWLRYQEPAVQIYGDPARSAEQRLDDLVVRLYWLIHRKTEQNGIRSAG
jgi:hypothetical protein